MYARSLTAHRCRRTGVRFPSNAQVIREQPQDWFYTLLQRAPAHMGELKSNVITEIFFNLPEYERRKVLATLKAVCIQITDPRPYTYDVNEAPSDIMPGGDVRDFIQHLDKAQQQAVENERREEIGEKNAARRPAPANQTEADPMGISDGSENVPGGLWTIF